MGRTLPPLQATSSGEEDSEASGVRAVDRRLRVLVVDDEPMIGSTLKRILSPLYDVTAVTSGVTALSAIRAGEEYDVILCDVMMPVLSGVDVYEALSATHPRAAERFVFITGGVLHEKGRRFLDAIPNPVVHKPFDIRAVRDLVRRIGEQP